MRYYLYILFLLLCLPPACAEGGPAWARFASTTGTVVFLGLGTGLPLVEDGDIGDQRALRTADTLATTSIVSDRLKYIFGEERPDGSDRLSFPSSHAATTFAVATMRAEYEPGQAVWWYLGASVIAASRVKLRKHYMHDVLAGAALGYVIARIELSQPDGLLFTPWVENDPAARFAPLVDDGSGLTITPWMGEEDYGLQAKCRF